MRVQVGYVVPVEVVVDTVTETVERVVVLDEEVKLDRDDSSPTGKSVHDCDYNALDNEKLARRAVEVAEDGEWPAWEFGW